MFDIPNPVARTVASAVEIIQYLPLHLRCPGQILPRCRRLRNERAVVSIVVTKGKSPLAIGEVPGRDSYILFPGNLGGQSLGNINTMKRRHTVEFKGDHQTLCRKY